jgi:hypothetical protein
MADLAIELGVKDRESRYPQDKPAPWFQRLPQMSQRGIIVFYVLQDIDQDGRVERP